jgi:hypothetical protein
LLDGGRSGAVGRCLTPPDHCTLFPAKIADLLQYGSINVLL